MSIIESIFLAITQGISEFLPISSSFHLIFFRDIVSIGNEISASQALAFDVALHFGTLLAIIAFFFKDFLLILKDGLTKGTKTTNGKLMWYIVIATIPAALAGVIFSDVVESFFRKQYILMSVILLIVGIAIYLIDKKFKQEKEIKQISFKDIILIGISQSFALIPGFSRSGTTIAMGRARGLTREDAAKFSFYLSVPVVLGAVILTLFKDGTIVTLLNNKAVFISGILVSFLTGLIAIKFLLQYVRKHDFKIFMIYRIILAVLAITLIMI